MSHSIPVTHQIPFDVTFGPEEGKFRGAVVAGVDPIFSHQDNYHWLRDDTRSKPEILDVIKLENEYSETVLTPFRSMKEVIFEELKSHMREAYR